MKNDLYVAVRFVSLAYALALAACSAPPDDARQFPEPVLAPAPHVPQVCTSSPAGACDCGACCTPTGAWTNAGPVGMCTGPDGCMQGCTLP